MKYTLMCALLFCGALAQAEVLKNEKSLLLNRLQSLGGPAPLNQPKIFGLNTISLTNRNEFGITMNRDASAFYFGVDLGNRNYIYEILYSADSWKQPSLLLTDNSMSFNDPMLSVDENRLYFMTNFNVEREDDFDIGFIQKTANGWTQPKIDKRISTPETEYFYSESKQGEAFFARETSQSTSKHFDIFSYREDRAQKTMRLPYNVNSPYYDGDPFISQDGRTLLFASSRPSGNGRGDIYISHRDGEHWTAAKPLPPSINTEKHELTPFITPDGQWLFFSRQGDLYWVSMDAIFKESN